MIELEVYAAGVRDLNKILELDHQLEAVPGLRYKVDSNHDIVYLELDEPNITFREIRAIFREARARAALRRCDPAGAAAALEDAAAHRLIFRRGGCRDAADRGSNAASPMLSRFFTALGAVVLSFFIYLGELVVLAAESLRSAVTHRMRWRLFMRQMVDIGLLSQLVVVITGGFTGAVFAAQTYFQFNKLGVASGVGAVVSAALFRELGPVLTGLMVTGRVGAAMSAEIGTMKVTEQIDALRALAVHPVDYLVVPRMLAMMVSMPLLVAECIFFGLIASYFVSVYVLDISGPYYVANMVRWTLMRDIVMGLTKGFCFALPDCFHQLPQRPEHAAKARSASAAPRPKQWSMLRSRS